MELRCAGNCLLPVFICISSLSDAGWRVLKEELGWDASRRIDSLNKAFDNALARRTDDVSSAGRYRREHCQRFFSLRRHGHYAMLHGHSLRDRKRSIDEFAYSAQQMSCLRKGVRC